MSGLMRQEGDFFGYLKARAEEIYPEVLRELHPKEVRNYSSVLIPLKQASGDLFIMLNKRSRFVPQPGDLCFPGGGIEPLVDALLSTGVLLKRPWFVEKAGSKKRLLSLLITTALRESWEEVGLNPLKVDLVGVLPPQDLVMFRRRIIPFLAEVKGELKLRINGREVEKVIWLPLRELFLEERYGFYRLYGLPGHKEEEYADFPCFLHQEGVAVEILWGATYRIVMGFLKIFWGFVPPETGSRPIVPGVFHKEYLTGYGTNRVL